MATTNIELDIENITGVSDADDQFVISAQKFVVASVPKNLLKWAATFTVPGSHGGNTSQGINIVMPTATDSILDVSRNGFSATEVPYEMKGFIDSSASLYKSTNTYPKYYLDNAVTDKGVIVIVKPAPTDAATAIVLYVDFTKIDDDCDLRSAVIYKAASSEFMKLASDQTSGIDTALPLLKAAVDQAETAANKFESATESVFGDEDTFDTAASQLTRVKDALNNAEKIIDDGASSPTGNAAGDAATYLYTEEDTELVQGALGIAQSEIQRAQAHLSEWTSIGDMRVKEVDVALKEAGGYAQEIQTRINNKTIYMQSADKYYQWAQMEVQQYIQNNSKMVDKSLAMQAAQQQRSSQ